MLNDSFDNIKNPKELLEFMDNITYGFIGKNGKKYTDANNEEWYSECLVQTGTGVLESKTGTCWDQVELERLWFERNNYNFKTIFVWFEVGRGNDYPTHTFLIYEKNGKWYWFEHAFENFKGIHEFNSEESAIEFVKEKQFEFAIKNNKNIKVEDKDCLVCYKYEKINKNLSVQDYFEHVTLHKINI